MSYKSLDEYEEARKAKHDLEMEKQPFTIRDLDKSMANWQKYRLLATFLRRLGLKDRSFDITITQKYNKI